MSLQIAKLAKGKDLTRAELLALVPLMTFKDGRTKQSFKDETDIQKIMARAEKAGTISHLQKYEGIYADFSDFDFHEQTTKLTRGREVFDDLPAEIRKEFGQSPAAFFAYVNDPKNIDELAKKLPHLAQPGKQNIDVTPPDADQQAAQAAASEPASVTPTPDPAPAAPAPPDPAPTV